MTMSSNKKPLIGIVCCKRKQDGHYFHMVGEKYINAINNYSGCTGVLVPIDQEENINLSIIENMDGFLLTGSLSNVHPNIYQEDLINPEMMLDEPRDQFVFSMIKQIIGKGMPLLAICRGFQEMNVAFGGKLYQDLERDSNHIGHDFDRDQSHSIQYGLSHEVKLIKDGLLNTLTGLYNVEVNSLHTQGVKELGEGLTVEAVSHEGLVEAFTVDQTENFNLSVQWHPEWKPGNNLLSQAIFDAFGIACQDFQNQS